MIGLIVLIVAAVYLALLIWAMRAAYRWGKKRGLSTGKCWTAAAVGFLVVYLPVFWDHIPTLLAHKYYCEKEAGFWVYKTIEQWKKENREALKELDDKQKPESTRHNGKFRFWTTQRFYTDFVQQEKVVHAIGKEEAVFYDAETKTPIARAINFWRGKSGNVLSIGGSLEDIRQALILGWGGSQCGDPSPIEQMRKFRYEFQRLGERK